MAGDRRKKKTRGGTVALFLALCFVLVIAALAALGFHIVERSNIKVKVAGFKLCGDCADILAEKLDVNHGEKTEKLKTNILSICSQSSCFFPLTLGWKAPGIGKLVTLAGLFSFCHT